MRDHGVANFPDPQGVALEWRHPGGDQGRRPCQLAAVQRGAERVPRHPPRPSKADLAAQAKQQQVHKQDLLAFADCLRNRGIAGFPDPDSQGQLTVQMVQAAGIDLTAPQVRTAASPAWPLRAAPSRARRCCRRRAEIRPPAGAPPRRSQRVRDLRRLAPRVVDEGARILQGLVADASTRLGRAVVQRREKACAV